MPVLARTARTNGQNYAASLADDGPERALMVSTLNQVVRMPGQDTTAVPWASMRYAHVAALQAELARRDLFSPA